MNKFKKKGKKFNTGTILMIVSFVFVAALLFAIYFNPNLTTNVTGFITLTSKAIFEIPANAIIITGAEHLDSNRNFISDITENVKNLDNNWSRTIPDRDYVRITFEIPLDSSNDITIFPRTVSRSPRVEVYEVGGTELIAEFTTINSDEYNKIFLTNLIGKQDIFDLRIVNGSVKFDHIIDPSLNDTTDTNFNLGTFSNTTVEGTGAAANVTLHTGNLTGNFTSQELDAGEIVNWTFISWNEVNETGFVENATGTIFGNMTGGGGNAAAFDGNLFQPNTAGARGTADNQPAHVGKDWGAGVTKILTKVNVTGYTGGFGFHQTTGISTTLTVRGSNTASTGPWTTLGSSSFTSAGNAQNITITGLDETTAYRYHMVQVSASGTTETSGLAEVQFHTGTNLSITARTSNNTVTWTPYKRYTNHVNSSIGEEARYIQYTANFTTRDSNLTSKLLNATVSYVDLKAPSINFTLPTLEDGASTLNSNVSVNVSINNTATLKDVKFNWNGANYSIYNNSLVLMYNFDNVSTLAEDDLTVVDASRRGNNGTVVGGNATIAGGKFGRAMQFDGVNDYLTVNNDVSLDLVGNFTISTWFKLDAFEEQCNTIISKRDAFASMDWEFFINAQTASNCAGTGTNSEIMFWFGNSGANKMFQNDGIVPSLNEWHHVVVTRNTNTFSLYLNGILRTTDTSSASMPTSDTIRVGVLGGDVLTHVLNGLIDEVHIYNRTLSAAEINQSYMSNLRKYDSDKWLLNVTQQKSPKVELADGTYTYQAYATDNSGNTNATDSRSITIDTIAPNFTKIQTNTTEGGNPANFSVFVFDSSALHPGGFFIFSTNNSGSWVNDSSKSFGTTGQWANSSKVLASPGTVVGYQWYIYDNAQNANHTALFGVSKLTTTGDTFAPNINFTLPTRGNASSTSDANYSINVSINNTASLKDVKFNWNGANYSIYNNSLVLMYNFDNVSGIAEDDLTVVDASRRGNNGTVVGGNATIAGGKFGRAMQFDGVDDRLSFGSSPSIKPDFPFSASFWWNLDSTNTGNLYILQSVDTPGDDEYQGYGIVVNSTGNIRTRTGDNTGPACSSAGRREYTTANSFSKDEWHHGVVVFRGINDRSIYVDGIDQALGAASGTETTYSHAASAVIISGGVIDTGCGSSNYGKGLIDEIRLYNRSLSAAEVNQTYMSNLRKYDSDKWLLNVTQQKSPKVELADGTYTYQAYATDNSGNTNATDIRYITIDGACGCPSSGNFQISGAGNCVLSTACNIGANNFSIVSGNLFITSTGSLNANSCYVQDGQGLFIEDGGKLICRG